MEHLYDVIGHGDPKRFFLGKDIVSAAELADEILRQPDYIPGTPIRLVSCNTGACPSNGGLPFAKHLANELGVPVYSPNAYVAPQGDRFVLTSTYHPGDVPKWILFQPEVYKYSLRLSSRVLQLPEEILGQ